MTERLSQLMHAEVDALDIPLPRAGATLTAGRRLRTRHRVTQAVAGVAAVAVVGSGAALWMGRGHDTAHDPVTTRDAAPFAYGIGSKIFVGDQVAIVPDTVHSMHYTSAGMLVRSNPNDGASDGSGPEDLTLVRWDGTTKALGTIPEGVGPATDPDQPYYALAEADGDGFVAVVRDAETGDEVERVALPDLPSSYWDMPPLGLSGDTLYVGYKSSTVAVDWHTGDHHVVGGLPGGIPEVYGGHAVILDGDTAEVVDADSGETLVDVPVAGDPNAGEGGVDLSPDGRFALAWAVDPTTYEPAATFEVYDVATGSAQEFPGAPYGWGWTADGDLFQVKGDTVTTCDAATADCVDTPAPAQVGTDTQVRLGGRVYES